MMDVEGLRGSLAWMLGGREGMLGTLGTLGGREGMLGTLGTLGGREMLCVSDCELGLVVMAAARTAAAAAAARAF